MYRDITLNGTQYRANLGIQIDHRITIKDGEVSVSPDLDGHTPGAEFEATFTGRGNTRVLAVPEEPEECSIGDAIMEPGDDLAMAQADKRAEISAAYNHYDAAASAQTSLGYPLQVGQAHISKLDGAIRYAEMMSAQTIYITDADNVTHEGVTLADARTALLEAMGAAMAAHHHKQELRAAVDAAETVEAVRAVSW
jgi:hypothetical protein